jgi:hypothetical protein
MSKYNTAIYNVGFKGVIKHINRKYPYIVDIEFTPIDKVQETLALTVNVNIVVDLNIFYDYTNTRPPNTKHKDYNLSRISDEALYLFQYNGSEYNEGFGYDLNDDIIKEMNWYYGNVVPKEIRYTTFQDWSDDDFIKYKQKRTTDNGIDFYRRWRDAEEPITFYLKRFKPVFDLEKLKTKFPSTFLYV